MTLYIGTLFVFVAITLLITYAFRAIRIRKDQFVNYQKQYKYLLKHNIKNKK